MERFVESLLIDRPGKWHLASIPDLVGNAESVWSDQSITHESQVANGSLANRHSAKSSEIDLLPLELGDFHQPPNQAQKLISLQVI
jgi:hypothetical protein